MHTRKTPRSRHLSFTIILALMPLFAPRAEWPTQQYSGVRVVNDPDRWIGLMALIPDNEDGVLFCVRARNQDFQYRFYIQGIDIEGNPRWDTGPPNGNQLVTLSNWRKGGTIMAQGNSGEIWVAWADYEGSRMDEDGDYYSSVVRIQKLNENRNRYWGDFGILVADRVTNETYDIRGPVFLEPQDNGSIIVLWTDHDIPYVYDEGNLRAQKYSSDGEALWQDGGIAFFPDSLWGTDRRADIYVSDGGGGILTSRMGIPMRLLPNGTFAWEFGDVRPDTLLRTSKIGDIGNRRILYAGGNEDNEVHVVGSDTAGQLPWGTGVSLGLDYDETSYIRRIGICGFAQFVLNYSGNMFSLIDSTLNPIQDKIYFSLHDIYIPSKLTMGTYGIRYIADDRFGDPENLVMAYDTLGNHLWSHSLDTVNIRHRTGYGYSNYYVDDSGNTWVFWTKPAYPARYDIYANIISPDGNLGEYYYNEIKNNIQTNSLPHLIKIHPYPNPFNHLINIMFQTHNRTNVSVEILNLLGRKVFSLYEGELTPGKQTFSWNASGLSSGIYIIDVRDNTGDIVTQKVHLIK